MLHFTYPIKELKHRGYKFEKLYNSNYKVYTKYFGKYQLTLWVSERKIMLNSYDPENLINCYIKNRNVNPKSKYIYFWINDETMETTLQDTQTIAHSIFVTQDYTGLEAIRAKCSDIVIYKKTFDLVVKEIKILCKPNQKIIKGVKK